jgi:hypothetical protein
MIELLRIDAALCAALIMVAACITARRWCHSSDQPPMPARKRRRAATELAGEGDHPAARQLSCPGSVMTPWRQTLAQMRQRSRSRQRNRRSAG